MNILYVFLGAGIGGVLRYLISLQLNKPTAALPVGTILVNILGCFIAGLLLCFALKNNLQENLRLFFIVGILGGFTTFSAFGMETISLLQNNHVGLATTNILLSLSGLLFTYTGYLLAQKL